MPTAEGLHGGGRGRQEVALGPQQLQRVASFPPAGSVPRQHPERQVGDVDVARVVPFVRVVLAALPVPPGVRLVPVVGADGHGDEPQSAESQNQTRHG